MPRKPTGKRATDTAGNVTVRAKNANGSGSVFVTAAGSWRATWTDHTGKRREVQGRTQAVAVARRDAAVARDAEEAEQAPRAPSRFTRATTVAELAAWWLEQQRHRVRPSSLAKYADRVRRLDLEGLGTVPVHDLRPEQVADWQAGLLEVLSPSTVTDTRGTLRAVLAAGVDLGLCARDVADCVKAPKVTSAGQRALTPEEVARLITAAEGKRLGAAVVMLFLQGWRISEVLGLAWGDVDLAAGTATVRRAAVYVDGHGTVLGPCKTEGAEGVHRLAPTVVELLRRRRVEQTAERLAAGPLWETHSYEGQPVEPVFTTTAGALVNRQSVTKVLLRAAEAAGLDPAGIATHTGRRTVVTNAYAVGGLDLGDVARLVGHANPATTAGYVRHLGKRPEHAASVVFGLLDPAAGGEPR
jgi:integrase